MRDAERRIEKLEGDMDRAAALVALMDESSEPAAAARSYLATLTDPQLLELLDGLLWARRAHVSLKLAAAIGELSIEDRRRVAGGDLQPLTEVLARPGAKNPTA